MVNTEDLATYIDGILLHSTVKDASQNGIQVRGDKSDSPVTKVCSSVDAGFAVLEQAIKLRAQFLIVHHGLLWGRSLPVDGPYADKIRLCMENGLTLFASHLPLDTHPEFGNSAILGKHFGLTKIERGFMHGQSQIGVIGEVNNAKRESFVTTANNLAGSAGARLLPFGPTNVSRVGIVSGGTSTLFEYPEIATLDLLITGEARQSNFHDAMERKINLLFVGHYASETVGVRAIGEHLRAKFSIEHEFIDMPTGI